MTDPVISGSPQNVDFSTVAESPATSASNADRAREREIVTTLNSYFNEADNNRKSGMNPRDDKWRENLNLYWNRHDFSRKAVWQAKETMPEVPAYVDRFAAALKEALISVPEGFYTIEDPADQEGDLATAVKAMTDVWLSRSGRNQMGQLLPFSSVFEEQVKLGALMACSSVTLWKNDVPGGRVAIETVDPRNVWLDHTFRNLYRIRRVEVDKHDLQDMIGQKDAKGRAIFNLTEMQNLVGSMSAGVDTLELQQKQELTGHGQMNSSGRVPIILDEYVATVVNAQGEKVGDRALFVVANKSYLIRGPEKNPFWHGTDWLTFAPLVTAPLSVYGRSYMEDFGSLARTFTELTNMILDAVHTTALKAYAIVPGMLLNPEQIAEGLTPNKVFLLDDGFKAEDFAAAIDLGTINADAVRVWTTLKSELSEAAGMNEIGLGQFAPNARTSATEVLETKQSGSALIRSVAQTIETRYLDPTLDLTWKTGLQHASKSDKLLLSAVGQDLYPALIQNRKEMIQRPFTFQARGISTMIQKTNTLKALLAIMQMISSNQALTQVFMQEISIPKLVNKLFELSNIDLSKLTMTDREKAIAGATQPLQQVPGAQPPGAPPGPRGPGPVAPGGGAAPPPQGPMPGSQPPPRAAQSLPNGGRGAQAEMQGLAKTLGIGR